MTEPEKDCSPTQTENESRRQCLENWPDAANGEYHPSCCRFPKSCSIPDMDCGLDNAENVLSRARGLLGQDVVVKLDDNVIARGRLIAFDEGGEAVVVDEMGFTHWCWPMLDIHPLTPENVESPS